MRLLHVIRSLNPVFGGPPDSVRMFCAAHKRAGNEVEVATTDLPTDDFARVPGVEVHALGPTQFGGPLNYHYTPKMEPWLRDNIHRFDGVIVNGIWQYHAVAVRKAVHGKRPYVVFSHGMLDPYFKSRYPVKHLKKLAYWLMFEAKNLNMADAVLFTSEEEKRIAGEGFPFREFRRVVIPYGTMGPPEGDPQQMKQEFLTAFPEIKGKPYIAYLSRIHPKKGCDLLFEAFARTAAPEMHLVMAGHDETGWRQELDALAARLGVQNRIHWTGSIRGNVKWGALYGAEAFILPSHQENFGIAVADALAAGVVPLISDKINIAPDIASDNACIMEPDTLEGTVRLIERFNAMTPEERAAMKARGMECYQRRYALTHSAQEVYKALGIA
jgi:glycosyltransferase involved in cell wall biosynthesis